MTDFSLPSRNLQRPDVSQGEALIRAGRVAARSRLVGSSAPGRVTAFDTALKVAELDMDDGGTITAQVLLPSVSIGDRVMVDFELPRGVFVRGAISSPTETVSGTPVGIRVQHYAEVPASPTITPGNTRILNLYAGSGLNIPAKGDVWTQVTVGVRQSATGYSFGAVGPWSDVQQIGSNWAFQVDTAGAAAFMRWTLPSAFFQTFSGAESGWLPQAFVHNDAGSGVDLFVNQYDVVHTFVPDSGFDLQ